MVELTKAEQFFYDNCGYSWGGQGETAEQGHIRTAKEFAKAEQEARDRGLYFLWYDGDECIGCECGSDECPCFMQDWHDTFVVECVEDRHGDNIHRASLGSVCTPTLAYRRVVEAELALEALAEQST